ncbi:hypothetical protein COOONC_22437, partial [Cooperia oncophora]
MVLWLTGHLGPRKNHLREKPLLSWEPDEVETVLKGKVIDGWTMENSLGSGANGIVLMCKKGSAKAVLKLALSSYAAASLEWESLVMDRIIARQNTEDRTVHLVRKIGNGSTELTIGDKARLLAP